jgi:hypothetical protein
VKLLQDDTQAARIEICSKTEKKHREARGKAARSFSCVQEQTTWKATAIQKV